MTIKVTYNVTDVYMTQSVSPVYINVSYSGGGSSGGGVWGTITGTLSNQTDLQSALDAKFDDPTGTTAQYIRGDGTLATFPALTGYVPYTGATTNVDLGEYELKAGQLTLDVSPTGTAAVGTTRWNDTLGSSETTLKGGSVILKNGVDLVARVVNKVSPNTTLTKAAYQAVRVSGAQGQRLAVAFAQANNDNNSADTIGLVIETIPTNQEGFIITVGQIENINTTGSLQGETWADGDVLYLSPTIAGAITNVKPTGGGHLVIIGYVEYAHANNGKIYVKVANGWEITELHDVDIVSPANNEALIYESSSALWKNKSIATALGYTPANAATTLTINGVTYDLSTSRTWTISTGISGTIATGQVAYGTAANTIGGSNNLFWDNTNGRLGIGTNAPANLLDVRSSLNAYIGIDVTNSSSGNGARSLVRLYNNNGNIGQLSIFGSGTGASFANKTFFEASKDFVIGTDCNTASGGTSKFQIYVGGYNAATSPQLSFHATANLSIGSTSDNGQRLQVYGDTLLRGSGATSATTALTVQNSSSTNLFVVRNDGNIFTGVGVNFMLNSTLPSRHTATNYPAIFIGESNSGVMSDTTTGYKGVYLMANVVRNQSLGNFACQDTTQPAWVLGMNYETAFTDEYAIYRSPATSGGLSSLVKLFSIKGNGYTQIGGITATALLDIAASTTTRASLRIRSGTAPTTPNDGDIWFDGTDIKMRIGGVTKTFTLV